MNLEEIKAAVSENSELATNLVEFVMGSELSKGKRDEIATNYFEANKQDIINDTTSNIYTRFDEQFNSLKEILPRKQNERTVDYAIRLSEKVKSMNKNSNDTKGIAKDVHELIVGERDELKNKLEVLQQEKRNSMLTNPLEKELSTLIFKDEIPESMRNDFVKSRINGIVERSKLDGEAIKYIDSDGKQYLSESHSPLKPIDILKLELSDVITDKTKTKGVIIDRSREPNTSIVKLFNEHEIALSGDYKKKSEFIGEVNKIATEKGIATNSNDWDKFVKQGLTELCSELPN
jgi:hypothetical protein